MKYANNQNIQLVFVFGIPTIISVASYMWLSPVSFFEKLISTPCIAICWCVWFCVMKDIIDGNW